MVRCPNCGSSSQVRILNVMICDTYVGVEYTCGCVRSESAGDVPATSIMSIDQWNNLMKGGIDE